MMQNQSIIYHYESILEMQVLCFAFIYLMFVYNNKQVEDHMVSHGTIMNCLLIEHIVAYACNSFRNYDIKKNGVPDAHGVYRAPTEWTL